MARAFIALLAVYGVFFGNLASVPSVNLGKHCPTAPVQEVVQVSLSGSVANVQARAPRVGEKDFVQCFCAQKQASSKKDATTAASKAFAVDLIAQEAPLPFDFTPTSEPSGPIRIHIKQRASWPSSPLIPPPQFLS